MTQQKRTQTKENNTARTGRRAALAGDAKPLPAQRDETTLFQLKGSPGTAPSHQTISTGKIRTATQNKGYKDKVSNPKWFTTWRVAETAPIQSNSIHTNPHGVGRKEQHIVK